MEDTQIFEMWETFKQLLEKTGREGIQEVIKWLDESDFKFAPASTKFHNSFRGGLLKHSLDVYYHMYDFKTFIDFFNIPEDTIILTSLLHDVCKVNCYKVSSRNVKNEEGQWIQVPYYEWEELVPGLGHGNKSVHLLQQLGLKLNMKEIIAIVNHMGFSNTTDNMVIAGVSKAFDKYPQALILHWADEAATWITENTSLKINYGLEITGRNITECNNIKQQKQTIIINGTEYKLAPQEAAVDGKEIIEIPYEKDGLKISAKVYSPHKDGLPF